jgi:hypothetical protein
MMCHEALLLELAEYKAKMKVTKERRRAIKKMMEPQLEKAQADLKLAEEGYKKTVTDLKSTGAYQGYRTSSSKDWKVRLRLRKPLEILYLWWHLLTENLIKVVWYLAETRPLGVLIP